MSLQVGAPTLHFEATRQPNHVVAKAHTQDRAHRGCRQRERPDIDTRHDQLRAGRNCGKVPRAIPCLEIAQRPHCSSKSRTDSVSSRCRSQAWDLRCGLAGQNISPWIHRQAAAAPAVQACLRPSLIKLQGHRPIVTAHRDGFSHDRRSLALGAIGHVWEANALACNAIEETCSRTALFREKTCLSSDRKAQFSLNRMLDGASERICPCFTRS